MVGGKCPTPCKNGGGISGRGNVRGNMFGENMSRGKCPDPVEMHLCGIICHISHPGLLIQEFVL